MRTKPDNCITAMRGNIYGEKNVLLFFSSRKIRIEIVDKYICIYTNEKGSREEKEIVWICGEQVLN